MLRKPGPYPWCSPRLELVRELGSRYSPILAEVPRCSGALLHMDTLVPGVRYICELASHSCLLRCQHRFGIPYLRGGGKSKNSGYLKRIECVYYRRVSVGEAPAEHGKIPYIPHRKHDLRRIWV